MKVRTMKGDLIDMGQLVNQNEKAIALGNASMNARGDIIGPNGQVIKKREAVTQEYNASNPKAVKQVALRNISTEVFASPAEAAAKAFGGTPEAPAVEEKKTDAPPSAHRKRKIEDRD